jgi:hypothetical protein
MLPLEDGSKLASHRAGVSGAETKRDQGTGIADHGITHVCLQLIEVLMREECKRSINDALAV